MTRPENETPKGWARVPCTKEEAPVSEIVVLVIVCGVALGSLLTAFAGLLIATVGAL